MAGVGHQYSIVGGKIIKEEVTRGSEQTQSTRPKEDVEREYNSEFSSSVEQKQMGSVDALRNTFNNVSTDEIDYSKMSMMDRTKISKNQN